MRPSKTKLLASGVIIRHNKGNPIVLFHANSVANSIIQAEVKALLYGLKLAAHLNLSLEAIEGDYSILIQSPNTNVAMDWKASLVIDEIMPLTTRLAKLHTIRECNMIADLITHLNGPDTIYTNLQTEGDYVLKKIQHIPARAWGFIHTEMLGILGYRIC